MHWVDVDGTPLPRLIAGHPALELCNTWAGWGGPARSGSEWLKGYDELLVWSGHVGLLDSDDISRLQRAARRDPAGSVGALAATRKFRRHLYAAVTNPSDRALVRLSPVLREAGAHAAVRRDDAGGIRWHIHRDVGLRLPLLATAHAAGEFLTSDDVPLVRACPGDDCGWLFIDRRGRRKWCSMSSCGNRAKVAAHARRQRDGRQVRPQR
jgi:predicted RNA-binding Zn ribbon-like protein